jgi:hypothetical protein
MNEQIPITVEIKKATEEANDIAERFALKNRVLKDTPSAGGFKMSQENLKKREKDIDRNGYGEENNYNQLTDGYLKNTFQKNQNLNEGSYNYRNNNMNSTNFKTNSEGKFYSSNSTSKKTLILN